MLIERDNTLFVLIDVQEKLFQFIWDSLNLQKNTIKLVEGMNALQIPTLVTEQYPKGLGATTKPIQIALGENYQVIEKETMSCWGCIDFIEKVESLNKKNIILAGTEAHVCVLQTAIELISAGYNVYVVDDCVSSRNLNDKRVAMERIWHLGGTVTSCEAILMELLRTSGTAEFKAISKIIK